MKIIAVVGTVTLLLLAHPAVSQIPDDRLVVPGQRIGRWTLEMTMDELVRMNGRPLSQPVTAPDVAPGTWVHDWVDPGLSALTLGRTEQRVVSLIARYASYETAKGVRINVSQEAVEAAYGKPTAITLPGGDFRRWIYDDLGLYVAIGRTIGVFRPGTAKQLFRY